MKNSLTFSLNIQQNKQPYNFLIELLTLLMKISLNQEFLEISDRMDHKRLIQKLEKYVIKQQHLDWFKSYVNFQNTMYVTQKEPQTQEK